MRETRRTLKAANTQLEAQIAVHNHVTRSALHEHMELIVGRNKQLIENYKKLEAERDALQRQVDELFGRNKEKALAA